MLSGGHPSPSGSLDVTSSEPLLRLSLALTDRWRSLWATKSVRIKLLRLLVKTAWGAGCAPLCQEKRRLCFSRSKQQHEVHSFSFSPSSGKVVAIKIHDLVPRSRKVLHKRLLRIVTRIDFCD